MSKIVYNNDYGGFSLSEAGLKRYAEIKGITLYPEESKYGITTYWTLPPEERKILSDEQFNNSTREERIASNELHNRSTLSCREFDRQDPVLVQVIEELGAKASGFCACLAIAELPAGTKFRIEEYDGSESVVPFEDYKWETAK